MTNLVSIADKKTAADETQADRIAKLRELFAPAGYHPEFRVGDIVRIRPCVARVTIKQVTEMLDLLGVVTAVRREGENWNGFFDCSPEDDVRIATIDFDKKEQRNTMSVY